MYVKDYDFIVQDIGLLFEKDIIIYGAGEYGKRMFLFLKDAGIEIECFCDKDENIRQVSGHVVIRLNELVERTGNKEYLIIVASKRWDREIIQELQQEGVEAYVCTWYGVRLGIELNVYDKHFSAQFKEKVVQKQELYRKYLLTADYQNSCFEKLFNQTDAILVYQSGKVGSSTINQTLQNVGIEAVHIHNIMVNCAQTTEAKVIRAEQIDYFKKNLIPKGMERKLKIITLVREPVGRALASYMQRFPAMWMPVLMPDNDLTKNAGDFVIQELEEDFEFGWFDRELKELTGIDIFAYPFDREKGYVWIKEENVEILVLKMEKMDDNEDVFREFAGKSYLKYIKTNIGKEKYYNYIYEVLKQKLYIPAKVLEKQFVDNPKVDHFYTEEEKKRFLNRWQKE